MKPASWCIAVLAALLVSAPAAAAATPPPLQVRPGVVLPRSVVRVSGHLRSSHRRVRLRFRALGQAVTGTFHRTGRRSAAGRLPEGLLTALRDLTGGATPLPVSASGRGAGRTSFLVRPLAPYGVGEDVQYLTGRALNDRLDAYRRLGVTWVRLQMVWSSVQARGPSEFDWKPYDAVFRGLAKRGLRPLVALSDTPAWARPSSCHDGPTCAPARASDYAAFAAQAVRRYAPRGALWWELWNEPNTSRFWRPAPDPAAYTALLNAAYSSMKAADPSITVITGGLAPAETMINGSTSSIAPLDFLSAVYADGGGGHFDAVGFHPYTFPALPTSTWPGSAWFQMFGTPVSVRGLMEEHGDGAKVIWGTEFGAPTAGSPAVTESGQSTMLTLGYRLWSAYGWTGPLLWYSYLDRGANRDNREDFFGLVRHDGAAKPAYRAFRDLTRRG